MFILCNGQPAFHWRFDQVLRGRVEHPTRTRSMEMTFQTGLRATPGDRSDPDVPECLIAPPVVTDGAGRALVMYQRLVESGFDTAQALNAA